MAIFSKLRRAGIVLAAGLGIRWAAMTAAQERQPIRLLVGFPPGGSTDTVARILADKLRIVLDQPVVVDNRPGAGGRLATGMLKNSTPDGSTYMVAPNATAIFPTLLYPPAALLRPADRSGTGRDGRVLSAGVGRQHAGGRQQCQ